MVASKPDYFNPEYFDPDTWGDSSWETDTDSESFPEEGLPLRNELRIIEKLTKWTKEITPQPEFGRTLTEWMATTGLSAGMLSERCGCKPDTVRRWIAGGVPQEENRAALRSAGWQGEFYPTQWSQSQFVRAELVKIRNSRFRPEEQSEEREFLQKYAVTLRMQKTVATGRGKARVVEVVTEEREYLFSNRVTEVIKVLSDGDAIANWTCCQALSHALGEPVLRGTAYSKDGVLESVEKRGSWRLIRSWQKKCLSCEITMDHARSSLRPEINLKNIDMLAVHERSYNDRYKKRNEAGQLGTRAHKLGQAWLKFHDLQERDENGNPMIEKIWAPKWFWNPKDRRSELEDVDLFFEPIEVCNALKALQKFFLENNALEIVATEELLADVVHGVAGAVDCIVRDKEGQLLFLDWKTSNGVYPPMLLQLAWYARLWYLCKGEMPQRAYIVRLDKLTAVVEVIPAFTNPEQRQKLLEAALMSIFFFRFLSDMNSYLADLKEQRAKQSKEQVPEDV